MLGSFLFFLYLRIGYLKVHSRPVSLLTYRDLALKFSHKNLEHLRFWQINLPLKHFNFKGTINFMKLHNDRNFNGPIVAFHAFSVPEMDVAFQMDDASFKAKYGFDKPAKEAPIVTHCMVGGRSYKAMKGLERQGYTNVQNYAGSFMDWKASGGDIENLQ